MREPRSTTLGWALLLGGWFLVACGHGPPKSPSSEGEAKGDEAASLPSRPVTCIAGEEHPLPEPVARVTALRTAAWVGDEERVKKCLTEGAPADLAWPGAARHPAILELVLAAGASVAGPPKGICPPCEEERLPLEACPLCDAARHGSAAVIERLLKAGADPEAPEPATGMRPLHLAAQRHALDVVQALIEGGADVDVTDSKGRTPLMHAVQVLSDDLVEVTRVLVHAGADPKLRAEDGSTARELARQTLGDSAGTLEPLLSRPP